MNIKFIHLILYITGGECAGKPLGDSFFYHIFIILLLPFIHFIFYLFILCAIFGIIFK